MIRSLIVAVGKNGEIGYEGALPWRLSADLKNFKKITLNHCVVMGRKTFESMGRALPKRVNIVLTRDKNFRGEGITVCNSLEAAFTCADSRQEEEVFVIGGAKIYEQALPLVEKLYLTEVDYTGGADTYFSQYREHAWKELFSHKVAQDENNSHTSTFRVLVKA